jgi:hypothetical protein
MASLIIQTDGQLAAGVFQRRVLIGRKPFNAVQFGQRAVSRVHAWIDRDGARYYIADGHSRTGTFVNGQKARGRHLLHDGDVIGIGPEKLVFRAADQLPAMALTFSISEDGTNPDYVDDGILIECECGAPLWVPAAMAGAFGRCAHCNGEINVPGEPPSGIRRPLTPNDSLADMPAITDLGSTEAPPDPLAAEFPSPKPRSQVKEACEICHREIDNKHPKTTCPACAQPYHVKCWMDNHGCVSYGCIHSGVSHPAPLTTAGAPEHQHEEPELPPQTPLEVEPELVAAEPEHHRPFPWDLALLCGSVLGTLLGAVTFGVPALAMAAATTIYGFRGNGGGESTRIAAVSTAICVLGVAIGVFTSMLLWFNGPFAIHH